MPPPRRKFSRTGWRTMTTELPPIESILQAMQAGIAEQLGDAQDALMIGIHSGGYWLAQHLHAKLGLQTPLGGLDISFYRDDFSRIGLHPQVQPSDLPCSPDGRTVVLVDDVLFTGRTIRAAMNELFDFGRPARIVLAVLIDRGGRELPIAADVAGAHVDAPPKDWQVKLSGPEPLALTVITPKAPA